VPLVMDDVKVATHEKEWKCTNTLGCLNLGKAICLVFTSTRNCMYFRGHLIMVALCNRADHYIFMLWFVYGRPM